MVDRPAPPRVCSSPPRCARVSGGLARATRLVPRPIRPPIAQQQQQQWRRPLKARYQMPASLPPEAKLAQGSSGLAVERVDRLSLTLLRARPLPWPPVCYCFFVLLIGHSRFFF